MNKIYDGHLIVDLTAGDAASSISSPVILANLGVRAKDINKILVFEKDERRYSTLIANLTQILPTLGYRKHPQKHRWTHGVTHCAYEAKNEDSSTITFRLYPNEWFIIVNDPNSIQTWALNLDHYANISKKHVVGLFSSMGCNAHGIGRMAETANTEWINRIEKAKEIANSGGTVIR